MVVEVKIRTRRLAIATICTFLLVAVVYLVGPLYQSPFSFEATEFGDTPPRLEQAQALPASAWHIPDMQRLGTRAGDGTSVWLRAIIPPAASPKKWVIATFGTPYLDKIDFYLLQDGKIIDSAWSGTKRAFSSRRFHDSDASFDFMQDDHEGRELWIRASSSVFLYLPISVLSFNDFLTVSAERHSLNGIFAGALIAIMIYNLLLFLALRDRAFLHFLAYQIGIATESILFGGFAHLHAPLLAERPELWNLLLAMILPVTGICFSLFLQYFLMLKTNQPLSYKLTNLAIVVNILSLIVTPFLPAGLAIDLNLLLVAVGAVLVEARLLLRLQHDRIYYVFIAFFALISCEAAYFATIAGILPTTPLSQSLISFGGVTEALFLSLATAAAVNILKEERALIIKTLKSDAPASDLNAILGHGIKRKLNASELNVSIMFIDVVGFSQIADKLGSRAVLKHLSHLMRKINDIIKEYHGTVDRSLGDGLLCIFGYDGSHPVFHHHANDAFAAAQRIQEHIVGSASLTGEVIMPLRIGIHLADVLIGDLGNMERIDFTMIGSGVNFANRLETACSPFKIMISEEFLQHLGSIRSGDPRLSEIHIAIKHHDLLTRAYEFNPFVEAADALARVERLHLDQMYVPPSEVRWQIASDQPLMLSSELGKFRVLDFSRHGFRVLSDVYIGQKAILEVELQTSSASAREQLKRHLLHRLHVEVRWSRATNAGFEHGFKFLGLNEEQRSTVFQAIKTHLASAETAPRYQSDAA